MALDQGTRFGPYEILELAGSGGMGEVYKARDARLDRTVAIKVLPAHASSNPESKQRFEREAQAIANLMAPANALGEHLKTGQSWTPQNRAVGRPDRWTFSS